MNALFHSCTVSWLKIKKKFIRSWNHEAKGPSSSGFTLIELMIVMVILGILTVIGTSAFISSQLKGHDIRRKGDLKNISLALEAFYNDKGGYPNDENGQIKGCFPDGATVCSWGEQFQDQNSTIYMPLLPTDAKPGYSYFYVSGPNNQSYQLYARLENTQDIDLHLTVSGNPEVYSNTNCGPKVCNYGVASTNTTLTDIDGHGQSHPLVDEGPH